MRGEGEQKNRRLSKNPARATENPVRYPGDEERSCEKAFDVTWTEWNNKFPKRHLNLYAKDRDGRRDRRRRNDDAEEDQQRGHRLLQKPTRKKRRERERDIDILRTPAVLQATRQFGPVAMSDAFQELADIPKDFVKDGMLFVNRCTKPDKREFLKISQAVGFGFLIMGAIGYFIKLIAPFEHLTIKPHKSNEKPQHPGSFMCEWPVLHKPLPTFTIPLFVIRHEHMSYCLQREKQQPIGVLRTDGKINMVATLRLRRFQPLIGAISSLSSFGGLISLHIFYFPCKLYEYTSFSFSNGHGYLPNWAIQFSNCNLRLT
ncbi:hypothetical protein TRV_05577 [Trichophyton verrucosum HKI 0517]|uniref:Protein translocation complex subunit Sss1 n=1 Tax=Trichophyton verrucosum (strain HKI 0517) TaxID=663202 RepID=D4DEL0_TRIVH|nr:uncharacterized protein TRV_05577 [Trichophyton verrucosum HKI 0517]EFE39715.1 hypothetical protein TRV_05577 [Trichophyton verrucosum HKI 0517]